MVRFRERAWSPYLSGIVLGLLVVPTLVVADTVPDPAAGLMMVGQHLAAALNGWQVDTDPVSGQASGARGWWQVALLVGIALGALLSASLSGCRRQGVSPVWAAALGSGSFWLRGAVAFGGGFVMMVGVGLAGGGWIGHGVSGVAQLAMGSILAALALAAGAVAAGRLLRRP